MIRAVVLGAAVLAAACVTPASSFTCDTSDQCTVGGTCQPTGYCSFADATCASGQRYSEVAGGGLANVCVGDEPAPDASNVDGPPGPDARPDAMIDAEEVCSAPFVQTANGCHGFFQPQTATYDGGRTFCQGMAADLAVIQDAAESNYIGATALVPGSAERALIGLDFRTGTWTWVDGSGLSFTNWSAGEPGAGENIAVVRPDGLWAGRLDTESFFIVCER